MTKEKSAKKEDKPAPKKEDAEASKQDAAASESFFDKLPPEAQEKVKTIRKDLDEFRDKIIEKFQGYILSVGLLPLPKPKEGEEVDKEAVNILVLVDDTNSQKMSKDELKDKLTNIIGKIADEVNKKFITQVVLLSEVWQSCYDAKYELLQMVAISAPIYDTGMLSAIKIAEVHKTMILKKFEKYIISYVLAGSLVQGKATRESDIDVWVVIDDTDVKKMTRAELKDKLRAIIIGMGIEAGEMTGIRNKLNIQVYILTEFWDSLKEANPIIFTLLRDGVPFYDRGIFMPWKQLLRMGRIKPSPEAIDMFMSSGEQMLERVHYKLKDLGMEDMFYAILTPSQAALMMYGVPPPTPRETPHLMKDIFVDKENMLEKKYIEILEKNIKVRKDIEHGTQKELSGKEVDELLKNAEDYLKRIKKLFTQIEEMKEKEEVLGIYETIVTVIRDTLRLEGIDKMPEDTMVKIFEEEMVAAGKIPAKYLRVLNDVMKAKEDYDANKLSKHEVDKVKKGAGEIIRFLVEYMQRKRGRELERTKIRVKHGNKYGEIILLNNVAYIIHDIDNMEKEVSKADIKEDGSLGTIGNCSLEELERELSKVEIPAKAFIKGPIFEDLKRVFGKDVEILINY